jgi:fibronectin type 3 domain-containing protein
LAAFAALVAGCPQPTDDPDPKDSSPTLTIKNESSYDLSNVTWSGITFVSSGQGDLLKGTASKKETTEDASGYIYFTRKDIGINLRTQSICTVDDSPVTISDNTVVIEVGNDNNRGALSGIGLVAEISVEYDGRSVARNDTINIGETVVNTSRPIQITLKSTGSGNLTLAGVEPVQLNGLDDSFSVTQPAKSEITASTPLQVAVVFTPQSSGTHTAAVTIKSNAPSGDFTFTLSGTGVSPKPVIEIFDGDTGIPQNGTIIMGIIALTQSGTVTVSVRNTGTEVLTIAEGGAVISGGDAGVFSFDSQPTGTISANGETTFVIRCTPQGVREYSATISIANNDTSRNPAVFLVQAAGKQEYPVIELNHGETAVAHNDTVGFGPVQAHQTKTENFSLTNTGIVDLLLSGNPVIASSNTQFTVALPSKTTVSPGETISFGITYTSAGAQNDVAQITIANDSERNPFVFTVTGGVAVPDIPGGVNASTHSSSSIQITWNASVGASAYKVYRSASSYGDYTYLADSSALSYTDTSLIAGTTYYYKVSARNAAGESGQSDAASALTIPVAPAEVTASGLISAVEITWNPAAGASSYKIYLSTETTPPEDTSYETLSPPFTITGLTNETAYNVWVQAVNKGGSSALSNYASGTPTSHFTVNSLASFQTVVSLINNDTAGGEYSISVTGSFSVSNIVFTSNAGKKITLEGASANRSLSNGNTSASLFTLPSGIELVLGNNITLNGSSKSYPVVRIGSGGTLTMNSGSKISGANNSGVRIEGGDLTINGGEVSGNSVSSSSSSISYAYGGGVYVAGGSLTMSSGTISGNSVSSSSSYSTSYAYGGGVYVAGGSFTMSGGTISGNSVSADYYSYGGGVCVAGGSFTMSGGTVSDNSSSSSYPYGGGVYAASGGSFNKTGGTITDTNSLSRYNNTRGRVVYVANGSKHRETEAGPAVNLNSASSTNWE